MNSLRNFFSRFFNKAVVNQSSDEKIEQMCRAYSSFRG
jgi:hypothetical protein